MSNDLSKGLSPGSRGTQPQPQPSPKPQGGHQPTTNERPVQPPPKKP